MGHVLIYTRQTHEGSCVQKQHTSENDIVDAREARDHLGKQSRSSSGRRHYQMEGGIDAVGFERGSRSIRSLGAARSGDRDRPVERRR